MDLDFTYLVDYDHEGYSDCDASGCDSICRCYTITRAWVNSVSFSSIKDYIKRNINITKADRRDMAINSLLEDSIEISDYYLDRLMRIHRVWDPDMYEVHWECDYYGDSITGVSFQNMSQLVEDLTFMYSGNAQELILYLLHKEYGYVTDKVIGKSWKIDVVDMDKIFYPQKEHYNNIDVLNLPYQDGEYDLPRGIVIQDGEYYRVVDGYHRLKSTNLDITEVIVGY